MVKLAVPFEIETRGGVARARTVPEGSSTELAQCIYAIASTVKGDRAELPPFGIGDPAFVGADLGELRRAVAVWEPRARMQTEAELLGFVQQIRVKVT